MLIELLTVRRGLGVRRFGVTQRFRIPSRRVWARVSAVRGIPYRGTKQCTKLRHLEKFAFGNRTIPIHARTLGPHLENPNEMGVYYGTVQSAVLHTN